MERRDIVGRGAAHKANELILPEGGGGSEENEKRRRTKRTKTKTRTKKKRKEERRRNRENADSRRCPFHMVAVVGSARAEKLAAMAGPSGTGSALRSTSRFTDDDRKTFSVEAADAVVVGFNRLSGAIASSSTWPRTGLFSGPWIARRRASLERHTAMAIACSQAEHVDAVAPSPTARPLGADGHRHPESVRLQRQKSCGCATSRRKSGRLESYGGTDRLR